MPTVPAWHQMFFTTYMVVAAMQAHCLYMRHLTSAHLLSATPRSAK